MSAPSRPSASSPFSSVTPGTAPPPPPPHLAHFTSQTSLGVLAGTLYGGYCGLVSARAAGGVLDGEVFRSRRHRAAAYFVRGSVLHGVRVGGFVALLSGVAVCVDAGLGGDGVVLDARAVASGAGIACGAFGAAVGGAGAGLGAAGFGAVVGGAVGAALKFGEGLAGEEVVAEVVVDDSVGETVRWLERGQEERRRRVEESEEGG